MSRSRFLFVSRFFIATLLLSGIATAFAQASGFTYQGRLTDGGTAANGNYDVQFALFDNASGGTQIGSTQTLNSVLVSAGVFSVTLDFGANSFNGANRFLEISARLSGVGSFTLLTPRQQVTATPYAIRSVNASSADTAINATTATNATQLGGIAASQYVQTNDLRLNDSRPPAAGSSNYIQTNPSSAQNASFNVSGNGAVGGTVSGNVINAATQFNIGGQRIVSTFNDNIFVGISAGNSNATNIGNSVFGSNAGKQISGGAANSFFGAAAGSQNTNGGSNSFFGLRAGDFNTTGSSNSFFGQDSGSSSNGSANSFFGLSAGLFNSTGADNSFFGSFAGEDNSTGNFNTMLGYRTNVGSGNLTNATAIGTCAFVTQSNSLILGSIANSRSSLCDAPAADTNVGIGTSAPVFRLHVVDPGAAGLRIQTNTGGGAVASFGGNGDFQIDTNGVAGGRFIVQQGGNVGIGTAAPDSKLTVNGTVDKPGGGSWGTFSDERLKDIRGRFTPGLRAVMRLQPLRYEYKRDNALNLKSEGEYVGFSAQSVQRIIPEAVTQNDKGYLLINNDPILWTMLNAIKEQQAQIQTLRTANTALNARLRALENSKRKRVSSRRSRD